AELSSPLSTRVNDEPSLPTRPHPDCSSWLSRSNGSNQQRICCCPVWRSGKVPCGERVKRGLELQIPKESGIVFLLASTRNHKLTLSHLYSPIRESSFRNPSRRPRASEVRLVSPFVHSQVHGRHHGRAARTNVLFAAMKRAHLS